jgi:hypothetical protein
MCTQHVSQYLICDLNCFSIKERKEGRGRRMMGWTDKKGREKRKECM